MSLKAFHVLFITLAVLMILACGVGWLWTFLEAGGTASLMLAVSAFVSAFVLIGYEVWFLRKVKGIVK